MQKKSDLPRIGFVEKLGFGTFSTARQFFGSNFPWG